MRFLLQNLHGTTSRRVDEFLLARDWEAAVLLEASTRLRQRLAAGERAALWHFSTSADRVKGRYPVVILWKGDGPLTDVSPARFGVMDGRCYDERIHAVEVPWDGTTTTIVGLHTPNAVRRSGRSDQRHKEEVYRQFCQWLAPLARDRPVIAGLDTNNGHWGHSPEANRPDMIHQLGFLRDPSCANLREAYLQCHPAAEPKPATWGRHFYDRVFLSTHVDATDVDIERHNFDRLPADGRRLLPDHATVWADLKLVRPDGAGPGGSR